MSVRTPTVERAREIWREAIAARAARLGPACPPRMLDWLDAATLERAPRKKRVTRGNPDSREAKRKRAWRANPLNHALELERAAELRRARGIPTREEHNAAMRAERESTREEREAARNAKRRTPEARAKSREKQARRIASMTVQERRDAWNRYQRAKRERDRAVREAQAAEAAE